MSYFDPDVRWEFTQQLKSREDFLETLWGRVQSESDDAFRMLFGIVRWHMPILGIYLLVCDC